MNQFSRFLQVKCRKRRDSIETHYKLSYAIVRDIMTKCKHCGKPFQKVNAQQIYCCKECTPNYIRSQQTGASPVNLRKVCPSTLGAISELAVATDLLANGWSVFRSLSPSAFCDLVAIKGKQMRYIEVRTGRRKCDGGVYYSTNTKPGVTEFAVYEPTEQSIEYIKL
jgi:hypothetical protein